jgi:hypothetical protein
MQARGYEGASSSSCTRRIRIEPRHLCPRPFVPATKAMRLTSGGRTPRLRPTPPMVTDTATVGHAAGYPARSFASVTSAARSRNLPRPKAETRYGARYGALKAAYD